MSSMKQTEKNWLKLFFSSANLTLFLIFIFIFSAISLVRQSIKYFSVSKQVADLERNIKKLEDKNSELSGSLEYLKSEFYQEKEARLKFNLQKPEEKVIILVPSKNQEQIEIMPSQKKESNFIKWWKYFFR